MSYPCQGLWVWVLLCDAKMWKQYNMAHTHFIYKCFSVQDGHCRTLLDITRHYSTKHTMYNARYFIFWYFQVSHNKGESNEKLKFVIKNGNFKPLSCKLVSMPQTACRKACRWQHSADARTPSQYQYKDGCPTWDLHQGRTAFCYSVFA